MYLMRGDVPLREMIATERSLVRRLGMRLLAPTMLKAYPFEEAFFLPMARRFREAVGLPIMLLGGLTRLDTLERALAEGFEFVALGRALLERALAEGFEFVALGRALIADPDLVLRMQAGEARASRCNHCNRCVVEMDRGGTRCVL
jgi:2,4-dienoyl-CoA reductase-like NADH-dependent reductase (Old Yellow Enzyme family)